VVAFWSGSKASKTGPASDSGGRNVLFATLTSKRVSVYSTVTVAFGRSYSLLSTVEESTPTQWVTVPSRLSLSGSTATTHASVPSTVSRPVRVAVVFSSVHSKATDRSRSVAFRTLALSYPSAGYSPVALYADALWVAFHPSLPFETTRVMPVRSSWTHATVPFVPATTVRLSVDTDTREALSSPIVNEVLYRRSAVSFATVTVAAPTTVSAFS